MLHAFSLYERIPIIHLARHEATDVIDEMIFVMIKLVIQSESAGAMVCHIHSDRMNGCITGLCFVKQNAGVNVVIPNGVPYMHSVAVSIAHDDLVFQLQCTSCFITRCISYIWMIVTKIIIFMILVESLPDAASAPKECIRYEC